MTGVPVPVAAIDSALAATRTPLVLPTIDSAHNQRTKHQRTKHRSDYTAHDLARRERLYEMTTNSPAFRVKGGLVACLVCDLDSIGYCVREHANGTKHQKKLCMYIPPAGHDAPPLNAPHDALNLEDAMAAAAALKEASAQKQKRSREE
jgi:hypothetical protein